MSDHVEQTARVVGGGPAGAVLALLRARNGVPVTLLEGHRDFDREFRGDTLHPSVMEIMDEIGFVDALLALPHTKIHDLTLRTKRRVFKMVDFTGLKTCFPHITLMPQVQFLEFITAQARRYSHFRLLMGAHVRELMREEGVCRGVRYWGEGAMGASCGRS